jgi:hypothetical protein
MLVRVAIIVFLALVAASTTTAGATETQQGIIVVKRWQSMDQCRKKAQLAFPDFTADANAKREAQIQTCVESQNLPLRAPLGPQQ